MIRLQELPGWDLQDGVFRAWWFDPLIATLSFAVFINWYWYEERKRGCSSAKTFAETVQAAEGPLLDSFLAYWAGVYLFKILVPPAGNKDGFIPDGIPHNIQTLAYLIVEIVSGIILYDMIFFFIHWAMHELPVFRRVHHRHHDRSVGTVEARDVLRHSLVDGSLQVLVNILVQRSTVWGTVKSRLARALHNVIVVWMLTESHSAVPQPWIWRRYFVGVREHRQHHLASSYGSFHRYQQFFGYLDDLRAALNGYVQRK